VPIISGTQRDMKSDCVSSFLGRIGMAISSVRPRPADQRHLAQWLGFDGVLTAQRLQLIGPAGAAARHPINSDNAAIAAETALGERQQLF